MIVRARSIPSLPGRNPITVAVIVGLLVGACSAPTPSPSEAARTGGTLRVALVESGLEAEPGTPYYDPAIFFPPNPIWRCLLRTLLSYDGRPIEEGGAELHPDLAAALPDVSPDGLTWTFRLKPGIHYGPPMADRVIEARDFVTAIEYAARHGDLLPSPIVGVDEYQSGEVDTIAGIEAPDASTLVIHLRYPSGQFANYMATWPTAPMPEEAIAGREALGYAGFLVASGPYMFEHAPELDLSDPDARPIWEGRDASVALVRNPSWSPAGDPLRGAYVDRIELQLFPDAEAAVDQVEAGLADVVGQEAPLDVVERYLADPELQGRVFTQSTPRSSYIAMNLAMPPFDDVHVRRAVNWILDRATIAERLSDELGLGAVVARHGIPDSLLNNLLIDYAPYATTDDRGDLRRAQEEMRASRYDSDGDGTCDAEACAAVPAFYYNPSEGVQTTIERNLAEIGINVIRTDADLLDPASHIAVVLGIGWGADMPRAENFGLLLASSGLSSTNLSLLGASSTDLEAWGYDVDSVPTLDPVLAACISAIGSESFECWASIDQLVMERVVAWAPLIFVVNGFITSERVAAFSADVYGLQPALERIQLHGEP